MICNAPIHCKLTHYLACPAEPRRRRQAVRVGWGWDPHPHADWGFWKYTPPPPPSNPQPTTEPIHKNRPQSPRPVSEVLGVTGGTRRRERGGRGGGCCGPNKVQYTTTTEARSCESAAKAMSPELQASLWNVLQILIWDSEIPLAGARSQRGHRRLLARVLVSPLQDTDQRDPARPRRHHRAAPSQLLWLHLERSLRFHRSSHRGGEGRFRFGVGA